VVPSGQFVDLNKGLVSAFLQGLRELGYVDGKNMKFEFYSIEGKFGQIDEIAARVLETSPDAILAAGGGANEVAHAFQRLTRAVPIIMANSSDPPRRELWRASPGPAATSPALPAILVQSLRQRDWSC
jgi:putative ABC transport system substrate-binding protein